ncbi:MAG: ATP phosphoribosyltransferase [bacterium]
MVTIALSKGRILKEETAILKAAGIDISDVMKDDRKLLFDFPEIGVKIMLLKPFDVPVYVEKGAADLGIVGRDVILEEQCEVFSILDLGIGRCRISVAKPKAKAVVEGSKLRVGTKFPEITRSFYECKGMNVEIIKLYGSIELAPLTGITDCIVDIVSSGETLRKNGLEETEKICDISSYLIANRTSFKTKFSEIKKIVEGIKKSLEQ